MQEQTHGRFFDVNTVGNKLGGDFGRSEHGADDAAIAVRERAHGIVDVDGMACAVRDSRAGLLVGGVGVAPGDDNARITRRVHAGDSAEQLRSNGENAGIAGRSLQEALQQLRGG